MGSRKGVTAMKHARAWVDIRYPGALSLESFPRLYWIPLDARRVAAGRSFEPKREMIPRTHQEDLFGCFDLIVFPFDWRMLNLVQVTTMHADGTDKTGTVATRKKKIAAWARAMEISEEPAWIGEITLMGWVPRKHFRVWTWEWWSEKWREGPTETAPLTRKESTTRSLAPRSA